MTPEQKKALGKQLKMARVWLGIDRSEVSVGTGVSEKQLRNIEVEGSTGSVVKYLLFLRQKGFDLNRLFDKTINSEF